MRRRTYAREILVKLKAVSGKTPGFSNDTTKCIPKDKIFRTRSYAGGRGLSYRG